MTGHKHRPPMPTATAHQGRLALFEATRRPKMRERIVETPHGKIRVKARLGQAHADVLEAICYSRERRRDMPDGGIKLLVDPAEVRRRSRQDGTTLRNIIDDLQQAIIEIIEPKHLACQGQVLGHIDKAARPDGTPITRPNPLGGERALWSATLGPVLSRLVAADVWIGYDPAPLAQLRHGISQAIARYALSHRRQPGVGWHLDTLITSVCGNLDGISLRHRRRELRVDDAALAEIGVVIDGDRVSVQHTRDGVQHTRDGVQHTRDGVQHTRDLADTYSDALSVHLQGRGFESPARQKIKAPPAPPGGEEIKHDTSSTDNGIRSFHA